MKKRIFSLLMAVCMIFNFMPLPAFATQEGVDLPAVETVVNETTTTKDATPPATGGETATPPTTGGETATPPTTGGETVTPPATGGDIATPPTTGGETATPPATGETTPPVNNEKVCTCNPIIGASEGGHTEGCPCFVADVPTCNCKPVAMPSGLVHAEGCPLFVAPPTEKENLCTCTHKCTAADENGTPAVIDPNCPVCNAQGADLALCMGGAPVALMLPSARTAGAWTGNGTSANDPYEIADVTDLQLLATNVNGSTDYTGMFFKLTANIDLSGVLIWTPIGTFANKFNGTFDGGSFEVKNLKITGSADYQALFGYISTAGVVKNLGVTGSVSGKTDVGGVVGYNYGTVTNCYNTATINGTGEYTGGVVGENDGTVENCYNTGTVRGNLDVGGVVGRNEGIVQSCYNSSSVVGTNDRVGGVVGNNENQGSVKKCYNTATVNGTGERVGGVVGNNHAFSLGVENCYNTGDVSGKAYVGGVVGCNTNTLQNCYNTGTVRGNSYVGGMAGNNSSAVTNCVSIGASVVRTGSGTDIHFGRIAGTNSGGASVSGNKARGDMLVLGAVVIGGATDANGADVKVDNTVVISTVFDSTAFTSTDWAVPASGNLDIGATLPTLVGVGGTQTSTLPAAAKAEIPLNSGVTALASGETYSVADETQLKKLASLVKDAATPVTGYTVNLNADIDLGGTNLTPIGKETNQFKGTFDGNGHTVNLKLTGTAKNQGLFGYIGAGGTVKNVGVTGTVTGDSISNVAGVAGFNAGTVTNCYNTATVNITGGGANGLAGVVGENTGTVEKCYNTATVTGIVTDNQFGSAGVGGVVGAITSGTVKNCYNTGAITGNNYVGGVAGDNDGTVQSCYNTGTVNSAGNVGGVVGVNGASGVTVSNCVSLGANIVNMGASTNTNFGRVVGFNGAGSISGNKARSDMLVKGETITSDNEYNINGVDVTVGTGTAQSTVFNATDFTNASIWAVPANGKLVANAALPTLVGVVGTQTPVLPAKAEIPLDAGVTTLEAGKTYSVDSVAQLEKLSNLVNTASTAGTKYTVNLNADIDLGGTNLTPIGKETNQFKGTFDGNGHTITLRTSANADFQGLFGYVGALGTVKNVTVAGSVGGSNLVGGVVGFNEGNIENCHNKANINRTTGTGDNMGGVVGRNVGGYVTNCSNTGYITGNTNVGGVVGNNYSTGEVTGCYNTGSFSAAGIVGGVVGFNKGAVKKCYNTSVISAGYKTGGIVGVNESGTVQNCYNTGTIAGSGGIGGVVGLNAKESLGAAGIVQNCYSTGTVTGTEGDYGIGGIVGRNENSTVTACVALGQKVTCTSAGGGTAPQCGRVVGYIQETPTGITANKARKDMLVNGKQVGGLANDKDGADLTVGDSTLQNTVFVDVDFADTAIWTAPTGKLVANAALPTLVGIGGTQTPKLPSAAEQWEGEGTQASPYLIKTVGELQNLATKVNASSDGYTGKYFKMCNDINVGTVDNWTPIGKDTNPFDATFDGGNFEVQNLKITGSANNQGLFGFVGAGGTVKNVGVSGTVSGGGSVAGVVGYINNGTVQNCYNTATITGTGSVGGVVGDNNSGGTVQNCYNTGNITGSIHVGGVVGNVGGVVGPTGGTVKNCYNTATITGTKYVGGVVGNASGTVQNCVSLGLGVARTSGTETIFGRVVGNNGATLSGNKARGDMLVLGAVVTDGATTVATGIDGATVAVGASTTQDSVFVSTAFNDTNGWNAISGTLTEGAKLPTLKGFASDKQNPTLPKHKTDISASITFADGTAEYDGKVQKYENATYAAGNGNFTYTYTAKSGSTLDASGKPKNVGAYTVTATYESATEKGSATANFTITAKPLTTATATVTLSNDHFTYDGNAKTPTATVKDGATKLTANTDYTVSYADNTNAGTAKAKVNITFKGNYSGSTTANFNIAKAEITVTGVTATPKTYDGTNTATVTALDFGGTISSDTLEKDVDYTVGNPTVDNVDAGSAKNVTGTATLLNTTKANNYNLADGGYTTMVTINQGTYRTPPTKTVNIQNGATRTGTISLADIFGANIPKEAEFGTITAPNTVNIMTNVEKGIGSNDLTYTSKNNNASTALSDIYTVNVTSKNYADFNVTITFNAVDKTAVTISGLTAETNLVYNGKQQNGYTGSVTVDGDKVPVADLVYTYTGTGGTTYNSANAPKDAGSYTLTVAVPDSNATFAGSQSVSFTIAAKPLTITSKAYEAYRYKELPVLKDALIYTGLVDGETMNGVNDVLTGKYTAIYDNGVTTDTLGDKVIRVDATEAETNTNYAITLTNGKLTVWEAKNTADPLSILPTQPIVDPTLVVSIPDLLNKLRVITAPLMPTEEAETNAWLDGQLGTGNLRDAHEVELQVSDDNGVTWRKATQAEIQKGTVYALLSLPEGATVETHNMLVYHFVTGANEPAVLENATYNATAKALVAEIKSCSPFVVVAVPKSAGNPVAPPAQSNNNNNTTVIDPENNFWISVVALIQGAKRGNVLKIDTGTYTKMPACVMEELRIKGAGMIIKWNGGKDIVIPVGKAHDAEKNRDIWTLTELAKMYGKYSLGNKTNPNTGVESFGIVDNQTGVTTPIIGSIIDATTTQGSQTGKYILVMVAGTLVAAVTAFGVCIWARKKEKEEE